jgi:hypothetical protein
LDLRSTGASDPGAARSGDTLAHRMEQGPLPLANALRYARGIATHLRDLHEEGRVHGEVGAHLVVLRQSEALLMPPIGRPENSSSLGDVNAFGSLLYEMLTGRKPTTETLLSTSVPPPPHKGPGAVQAAAIRLAERCATAVPENALSLQKVITELALFSVQARQWEIRERPAAAIDRAKEGTATEAPEFPAWPSEPDINAGESDLAGERPQAGSMAEAGDVEEEDTLADVRCPRCRCSKIRVSRPRNRLERFLRALGLPVRRCHRCYFRYIDLFGACLEVPTNRLQG